MSTNNSENWVKTDMEFKVNGIPVKWSVYHNIPDDVPENITNAFNSWVHRAKRHKARDFVHYVKSKNLPYKIYTQRQWIKFWKS